MKLSIIIVNYNVRFFLEQCLYSVFNSLKDIDAEVFVVDNNSVDGSVAMVQSRFEKVKLIVNTQNTGFAKANNQAIRIASGEYILLLNPDTIVEESTFARCIEYMDTHPNAGALGPKMIDGKGKFLPESKRGLPTPETAFYKIFGLTRIFSHSPRFARYYMGHTSPDETQEVDVLTGAFMFIRRKAIDVAGLLDEEYFMYGEDIDLSYRIQKAGFKVVYFPQTTIIHYKGESTKKGSLNYVLIFYKAMQIFARNHFAGKMAKTYCMLINLAIWARAGISILKRGIISTIPAVLDALLTYSGFAILAVWWENFWFKTPNYYPDYIFYAAIPSIIAIQLFLNGLFGGYRTPFVWTRSFKGIAYGSGVVLIIYALLPAEFRFSRTLILTGSVWAIFSVVISRFLLSLTGRKEYRFYIKNKHRLAIVGRKDETIRINELLQKVNIIPEVTVMVFPHETSCSEYFTGTMFQLKEIIAMHQLNEVIFSAQDVSAQTIIEQMKKLANTHVNFKIASPDGLSVIGSNSSNTSGEFYNVQNEEPNI